jgi:stage III sporulation protein AF
MFSTLSTWILSIAGIICVSVIIELVMPSGQMNRYIKGIFSFVIILVIIMPIPKLLKSKVDMSEILDYGQIEVDENYLYQVNLDKLSLLKESLEEKADELGYQNVIISISADIFSSAFVIKSVHVDLSQIGISENAPHKNIIEIRKDLSKLVADNIKIEEEKIYFNE